MRSQQLEPQFDSDPHQADAVSGASQSRWGRDGPKQKCRFRRECLLNYVQLSGFLHTVAVRPFENGNEGL
jgi:hypothetical protein